MHKTLTIEERAKLAVTPAERRAFLADFIESERREFDMLSFQVCGTPQCIAGWAVYFWGDFERAREYKQIPDGFEEQATDILEVDRNLFYQYQFSRSDAANALRAASS